MKIGLIWMAGAAVLVIAPSSARATIYECLDASGAKVLTDTPAQLKNCTPLSAGPMTPSTRPPGAVQERAAGSPPLAPTPMAPPSAPPFPAVPRSPSTVSTMPPSDPTEADPPPGADDELPPSGQTPPSIQPCRPGVNPLDPFGSVNCQPSVPPGVVTPMPKAP
jgi:hypothetical protein